MQYRPVASLNSINGFAELDHDQMKDLDLFFHSIIVWLRDSLVLLSSAVVVTRPDLVPGAPN